MATALITNSEYIELDNSPSPLPNADQVTAMIKKATAYIEKLTGQVFYYQMPSPDSVTEIVNGTGSIRLYVKNAPIQDVTLIEYWDGTTWQELSDVTTSYTFKPLSNIIYSQDGFQFWSGYQRWRVTYTYGYETAYPDDLKYACYLLAKHYLQQVDRQGLRSQADGEQSFSYDKDIPKEAITIINKYKRYI